LGACKRLLSGDFSNLGAMRFPFIIIAMSALVLVSCKLPWQSSDPTLARVGDTELKLSEMEDLYDWDSLSLDERVDKVEAWVTKQTVYEQALALDVDKKASVHRLLEDARKKIVLDAYFSMLTDTIRISESEIETYYAEHPDVFAFAKEAYSVALLEFAGPKECLRYYHAALKKPAIGIPKTDSLVTKVTVFDSVSAIPFDCPAVDLKDLSIGKPTPPKACKTAFKSVLLLSKSEAGTVRPFSEVHSMAKTLALGEKRKAFISKFKTEAKKGQVIFTYPEEIAKSSKDLL